MNGESGGRSVASSMLFMGLGAKERRIVYMALATYWLKGDNEKGMQNVLGVARIIEDYVERDPSR